jgi:uncharacterized membrane protein YphA (DoxX/SURF4 family)
MKCSIKALQHTRDSKLLLIARVLAGGPLVVFGIIHLIKPEHLRDILTASSIPLVDINVIAASVAELIGGVLLVSGFMSRIGALFGVATMLPAIYSTIVLMHMTVEKLPGGLTEVPFVPPMPLPVMIVIMSLIIGFLGGGRPSVDWRMGHSA